MKTRIILLALLLFCVSAPNYAQNDLSESDKEAITLRVKQKVEEFQGYLSSIVNTNLTSQRRQASISAALALFIGKGEAYTDNDGMEHGAVRMQLSSVNSKIKRWLKMKTYLWNQYNNVHRYGKVVIQTADYVRVDNFHKVGEGMYECMATYVQRYVAYNKEGKIVYKDRTTKKMKVYIDALEIPSGVIWSIRLGDVYVTATKLD